MDKEYFVEIDGRKVSVSKDIYIELKRSKWRSDKQDEAWRTRLISYEDLSWFGSDAPTTRAQKLVEDIVTDKILLESLLSALDKLTDDERYLINSLFYEEKTEREAAKFFGCSKTLIHKRKEIILRKLKDFLKKG
jgi:RNA polymerase sigma factor (sigma-70 family)